MCVVDMKKIEFNQNKNVIFAQVATLRKKKGLSQKDLAVQMQLMNVNIDQQMISRIERNKRIVTDYELACLCKILGVTEREMLKDFYDSPF